MLCVQCYHIFFFFSKNQRKEKKKKNPGSISLFCLSFVFSWCASDDSGTGDSDGGGGPCTFSSTESSSRQEGKHSEKGKGSDLVM